MLSLIQAIFEDKLITDDRSPLFTFALLGKDWGFYNINFLFWAQALIGIFTAALFSSVIFVINYLYVIPHRGSIMSYLVVYMVVCPFIFNYPFWALDFWGVSNKVVRFCLCAIFPTVTFFRTMEALCGFVPKGFDDNLKHYMLYNICILDIQYEINPKTDKKELITATFDDKLDITMTFAKNMVVCGACMTLCNQGMLEPYETDANGNVASYDAMQLLDFNLFRNNLLSAIAFQIILTTFTGALGVLASLLFSVKTSVAMKNPIMTASSPSDFWGNKWNLIIHGGLKRGIFKPVYRLTSTKFCAVLAAFFASGIMHEYLLYVTFYSPPAELTYVAYGKNTAFFMWNAGIVMLEFLVGGLTIFQWMKFHFPKPLITLCSVSMGLPVAHWFTHAYFRNGLIEDLYVAVPMIKEIPR